jgi:MoxR-like ATPase
MEEQQVTLDGESLPLPDLFWVIATQNSLEFEGTYPLPEAQIDRFLFKLVVDYPEPTAEKQMLLNVQSGFQSKQLDLAKLQPIATVPEILSARQSVQSLTVQENILDYLLALIQRTRQHPDISLGASPRSSVAWLQASKAAAWLSGRDFVTPDDVKAMAPPLLRHRLILRPDYRWMLSLRLFWVRYLFPAEEDVTHDSGATHLLSPLDHNGCGSSDRLPTPLQQSLSDCYRGSSLPGWVGIGDDGMG